MMAGDKEQTGEKILTRIFDDGSRGRSNDDDRNVDRLIDETLNDPRGGAYFDPIAGWTMPGDTFAIDTGASLKSIIGALSTGDAHDDIFDDVERLLYKYQIFILQGIRENIAKHNGVSWYLVDKADGRALISYQDGPRAEWCHECCADEVPLWLLIALLRRIRRQKPLGDQGADDTINRVDDIDAAYVSEQARHELEKNLGGLNIGRRGDDDE